MSVKQIVQKPIFWHLINPLNGYLEWKSMHMIWKQTVCKKKKLTYFSKEFSLLTIFVHCLIRFEKTKQRRKYFQPSDFDMWIMRIG